MEKTFRLLLTFTLLIAPAAASARNYALLVGVSGYELPGLPPLKGPPNDVRLMWDLLRGRGFDPAAITVLADKMKPGSEMPARIGQPTASNILASLDTLAKTVRQDDTVFFYFSGHGTKIPQAVPKQLNVFIQPDGQEKVLLALDAKKDETFNGTLPGGILGSTLREKLDTLAKKALVWVMLDACHAGGMTRGVDGVTERFADPKLLGIPETPPKNELRPLIERDEWVPDGSRGRVVAFLAADGDRFAVEQSMPGQDGGYFGFFTYNLAGALGSREYGSFRELANALIGRSAEENGSHPSPVFEGDLDQPLFDGAHGERRWIAKADASQKTVIIEAGALQGLSEGTVLALDDGGQIKAYATVSEADIAKSKAKITEYKGPKPDLGPRKILGATVTQPAIPFTLKVALPPAADKSPEDRASLQAFAVIGELAQAKKAALPISWVRKGSPAADVHLRVMGGVIYILPRSGELVRQGRRTTPAIKIGSTPGETTDALVDNLWRLLRQKNLLRIASKMSNSELSKAVEVRLRLFRDQAQLSKLVEKEEQDCLPSGSQVQFPLEASRSGRLRLTQCDDVFVEVINRWHKDVDVTLLYLNNEGGVDKVSYEDKARVPANRTYDPIEFRPPVSIVTWCNPKEEGCERYKPDGYAPVGMERLLVIVAEVEATPRTFHYLDQPGLDKAREELESGRNRRSPGDSFDELMRHAALAPDQTRAAFSDGGDAAIKVFQWEVVPPPALKLNSPAPR